MEFFELGDELFVDFLTTSGIENEDGAVLDLGPFEGVFSDFDEVFLPCFWFVNWDIYLGCEGG